MTNLPDTMRCPKCAAVFEVTQILAHPSEFTLVRGEIECPCCGEAKLDPETRRFQRVKEYSPVIYMESAGQIPGVIVWRWYVN